MDLGTLLLGFVPVASAAIGAGATYLWQLLGNSRTDKAVRIQTNVRLVELTTFLGHVYQSKSLAADITPTLQRLVTSLDDMQIALAFRRDPDVLWKLGQIRVACERISALNDDRMPGDASGNYGALERHRDRLRQYAGNVLALILTTLRDARMKSLARTTASRYGFSDVAHGSTLKGHVLDDDV